MIKAIIFDYDGVIVDSFGSTHRAYQKICEHFGVSCPDDIEEFRKVYGYNYFECLDNLGIKEEDFREASEIYKKVVIKNDHQVFEKMPDIIKTLADKYDLYIVSAAHSEEVISKIKKNDLEKYFQGIYCGADKGIRKSAIISQVLKEKNYLPSEVISIGDRVIDYVTAKEVGISDSNVILVTYGWGLDLDNVGSSNIAHKPEDILKKIEK